MEIDEIDKENTISTYVQQIEKLRMFEARRLEIAIGSR